MSCLFYCNNIFCNNIFCNIMMLSILLLRKHHSFIFALRLISLLKGLIITRVQQPIKSASRKAELVDSEQRLLEHVKNYTRELKQIIRVVRWKKEIVE